jgi:hypothetical protein
MSASLRATATAAAVGVRRTSDFAQISELGRLETVSTRSRFWHRIVSCTGPGLQHRVRVS